MILPRYYCPNCEEFRNRFSTEITVNWDTGYWWRECIYCRTTVRETKRLIRDLIKQHIT